MLQESWLAVAFPVCAGVTVALQTTFCLIAFALQTDKLTDFAGCGNFLVVTLLSVYLGGVLELRQLLVSGLVCVWALRLGAYLLMRVLKVGRDERFDKIRIHFLSLAGFWTLQAIWVIVVISPVVILNSPDSSINKGHPGMMTPLDWVGTAMMVLGMTIEGVADQQKFCFRGVASNQGKFCNTGLWHFSRHPNYFGEILHWWGVFIVTLNVVQGWAWLTLLSPVLITLLLLFVSGIPLLEITADKKYGSLSQYQSYKKSTSPLVPLPPALYKRLPSVFKLVLCEFPMYSRQRLGSKKQTGSTPVKK